MPAFIIETTAESPIREFWKVQADNAEAAEAGFEDKSNVGEFLWDEVTGDETDREVSGVHAFVDMAGTVAMNALREAAPAMLEILKELAWGTTSGHRMNELMAQSREILARCGIVQ